jgi:hypothetical protein
VALTGEEIKHRLTEFAAGWSLYDGSERSEAQTFLNELFGCYGTARKDVAHFEEPQEGKFLDLIWPRACLIEMKRPSEAGNLAHHRQQAFDYWKNAAKPDENLPAPTYVVLCAFKSFEVWQPGQYPTAPRAAFDLIELPDRYEALLFLAGKEPVFIGGQEAVTREAVGKLVGVYELLRERQAADLEVLRDFVLQSVWCMFAEDLGQLEEHLFTRLVERLLEDPQRSSVDELGQLFTYLNTTGGGPDQGLYAGVRYANGRLFAQPAKVHLTADELRLLRETCSFDWRKVQPSIFGSLMEGGLGHDMQWALGAHFTHEADIRKVVGPSIVEPWRERIENLTKHAEAKALQNELAQYVVLDPACGSGNFLYVAYRELRRLEQRLREVEAELRKKEGKGEQMGISLFFPITNIRGIELNGFAVAVARVTLWMGHKLAVDQLKLDEATLPLADLSGIQRGDALKLKWPKANVIVGNPPFHGDRHLRGLFGDDYVEWLKEEFAAGVKDYCVYWFRKAQDQLKSGQRAGLVGTNSVSQNRARGASLNYVVENGGVITHAVSTQDWPGEANVDVSIVNWIKSPPHPPSEVILDGEEVEGIDTALRPSTIPIADIPVLPANRAIAFQGFLPGAQFDISIEEGKALLARGDTNYGDVVKPYLDGRDLARDPQQRPGRYTIDFGQMSLEQAMAYPAALDVLRAQAKDARESSTSYHRNPRWWQFLWPRPDFRNAAASMPRFIAGSATGKRILFCWCQPDWRPSNSTNTFALASDFAMGVLTSRIHTEWARGRSSTLEDRIRYTPSSAFETFPWPAANEGAREQIGDVTRHLLDRRGQICRDEEIGLTELYNRLDDGAFEDLAAMHAELDRAVAVAYGWSPTVAADARETNLLLFEMNRAIAAGEITYEGPAEP